VKFTIKRALLVVLLLSFVLMGSNCNGTMSVGVAYPGAYGYGGYYGGPYGSPSYGGGYGGVYVGTTVPIW